MSTVSLHRWGVSRASDNTHTVPVVLTLRSNATSLLLRADKPSALSRALARRPLSNRALLSSPARGPHDVTLPWPLWRRPARVRRPKRRQSGALHAITSHRIVRHPAKSGPALICPISWPAPDQGPDLESRLKNLTEVDVKRWASREPLWALVTTLSTTPREAQEPWGPPNQLHRVALCKSLE